MRVDESDTTVLASIGVTESDTTVFASFGVNECYPAVSGCVAVD